MMPSLNAIRASDLKTRTDDYAAMAAVLMKTNGRVAAAREMAAAQDASPRVIEALRLKVDAGSVSGSEGSPNSWGAELSPDSLSAAFLESLSNANAFDAALPFMRPVPLKSRVMVSSISATGYIVGEGASKTIASLELDHTEALDPIKAVAVLVVSADLIKLGGPLATALLSIELRKGVAHATDAKFVADLIAATTPTGSSGDFLYDLQTLLSAIDGDSTSRYFVAVDPENAKRLAVLKNPVAGRAHPELTVNGGTIGGVTVVVSDQLTSGQVVAFDARQLAADGGSVILDASENATIDLAGGSNPTTSLWQKNLRALRAERMFGYEIGRPTAVSSISSADYTGDSPA